MINLLDRLASPLDADAYLSLVNPLLGTRLRGVIERIERVGEGAATITITPGRRWAGHVPGQFVTLGVDVNGVRHRRCYSVTSLPSVGRGARIQITVQSTAGGFVSDHLVHHASVGEIVQLGQAEGEFTLPDALPARLLFVTGGSGITPVMSMLRALASRRHDSEVVVLHHAATPERGLFGVELSSLADRHPWLRIETTHTRAEGGAHLDADRLESLCPDWRDREAFLCGPSSLIEVAMTTWAEDGISDRLHVERFAAAPLVRPSADGGSAGGQATFSSSGVSTMADGSTPLLEVAEAAGLAPAHGCRMGICHTCSTRLESGCVRDLRDGRLVEAGGHVQLCVTAAATDVALAL